MQENYKNWYSDKIHREFEMLTFGHAGLPVILFPTSYGRHYENKDRGLVGSVSWFVDQGLIKIYCPDGFDKESWYNKAIHPVDRIRNFANYERVIMEEVVPQALHETGKQKVILAGCSFGGFHAVNFAFRKPEQVSHVISMFAAFENRSFLDGHYDEQAYFFNPIDYMANIGESWHLENIRKMGIILSTGEHDICKNANYQFSQILRSKGINHWLDDKPNAIHDWHEWQAVFPKYVSSITQ
ncbi:MAG: esterase [Bacteroidetes bacterium]|nr:MAG: esterase [Bacteroidota bacterium]